MAPHIILLDAAYIDRVAANFRAHYAAELGRELPKADLAQWLVCLALDAEMLSPREPGAESPAAEKEGGEADVQCIIIHDREAKVMEHVAPGSFGQEIDGRSFTEAGLGEFALACCPVERVTTLADFCAESLEALLADKAVRSIAVVYDFDGATPASLALTDRIARLCRKHADDEAPKDVTLFTMRPLEGSGFAQQVLGFSVLAALGIGGGEL